MLDWQNKPWIKIISTVLIAAFLTYDIAWATDFTPLQKKQYVSRSLFKNKKVDQTTISSQNEQSLETIKDALSHKKNNNIKDSIYHKDSTLSLKASYINDIANIYINDTLGKVIDSYTPPDPKGTIIHIQDLHTNPEASLNLANILEILIKDYDLNLVCSEGATGLVDTSSVSNFPDKDVREKVARVFVNSGELTGEEYLSIVKFPNLPIWGIEDKDIYFQHIIEFNKIIKFSKDALNLINQIKDELNNLKPKIYSKALLDLDSKEIEYEESKLDTTKYLEYLLSLNNDITLSNYKNINIFKESYKAEKTIDQSKIIKESQEILSILQSILKDKDNKSEIKSLSIKASLFKDKKISPFSFYSYLDELARRHLKEDINKYPALTQFVDYLTKINSLDSNKLFNEIEELTYDIKDLISDNPNQKLLTKALRNIHFLESFFNLKVSNEELEYYFKDKDSFKVTFFESYLKENLQKYNIDSFINYNPDLIDKNLPDLENFYELAHKRDLAMFNNAISEIETRKPKLTALIAGGFHTQGITKLLKDNNYSYVVISPYSKTTIDEENYRNLLAGKRKPLKELISELNEKLRSPMGFADREFLKGLETREPLLHRFIILLVAVLLSKAPIEQNQIESILPTGFKEQFEGPIEIRQNEASVIHIYYKNNYLSLTKEGAIASSTEAEFKAAITQVAVIGPDARLPFMGTYSMKLDRYRLVLPVVFRRLVKNNKVDLRLNEYGVISMIESQEGKYRLTRDGRFNIGRAIKDLSGFKADSEVVLVGVGNKIEIWPKTKFEAEFKHPKEPGIASNIIRIRDSHRAFFGTYNRIVDEGYRIGIPTELRSRISSGKVILQVIDKNLIRIFDQEEWLSLVKEQSVPDKIFASAYYAELDATGRVLMPEGLQQFVDFKTGSKVKLIGAGEFLELYLEEAYQKPAKVLGGLGKGAAKEESIAEKYTVSIDSKGRLTIPEKYREKFKPGMTLLLQPTNEGAIRVFDQEKWLEAVNKGAPDELSERILYQRGMFGNVFPAAVKMEKSGLLRFLIPEEAFNIISFNKAGTVEFMDFGSYWEIRPVGKDVQNKARQRTELSRIRAKKFGELETRAIDNVKQVRQQFKSNPDSFISSSKDTKVNWIIDYMEKDSGCFIGYGDFSKISVFNKVFIPKIIDKLIPLTISAANAILNQYRGGVVRTGGDEVGLALPSTLTLEQVNNIRLELQLALSEFLSDYYGFVKVDGVSDENIDEINKALNTDGMAGVYKDKDGFFLLFDKAKPYLETVAMINKSLKDKNIVISISERDSVPFEIPSPRINFGIVKAVNIQGKDAHANYGITMRHAEYIQSKAKKNNLHGATSDALGEFDDFDEKMAKASAKKLSIEDRKLITEQYTQSGIELFYDQIDELFPIVKREYLLYAVQRMPSAAIGTTVLVRGPPDNFYIVTKLEDESVIIRKIEMVYEPQGDFRAKVEEAIKSGKETPDTLRQRWLNGYGFKITNEYVGEQPDHTVGNNIISAEIEALNKILEEEKEGVVVFQEEYLKAFADRLSDEASKGVKESADVNVKVILGVVRIAKEDLEKATEQYLDILDDLAKFAWPSSFFNLPSPENIVNIDAKDNKGALAHNRSIERKRFKTILTGYYGEQILTDNDLDTYMLLEEAAQPEVLEVTGIVERDRLDANEAIAKRIKPEEGETLKKLSDILDPRKVDSIADELIGYFDELFRLNTQPKICILYDNDGDGLSAARNTEAFIRHYGKLSGIENVEIALREEGPIKDVKRKSDEIRELRENENYNSVIVLDLFWGNLVSGIDISVDHHELNGNEQAIKEELKAKHSGNIILVNLEKAGYKGQSKFMPASILTFSLLDYTLRKKGEESGLTTPEGWGLSLDNYLDAGILYDWADTFWGLNDPESANIINVLILTGKDGLSLVEGGNSIEELRRFYGLIIEKVNGTLGRMFRENESNENIVFAYLSDEDTSITVEEKRFKLTEIIKLLGSKREVERDITTRRVLIFAVKDTRDGEAVLKYSLRFDGDRAKFILSTNPREGQKSFIDTLQEKFPGRFDGGGHPGAISVRENVSDADDLEAKAREFNNIAIEIIRSIRKDFTHQIGKGLKVTEISDRDDKKIARVENIADSEFLGDIELTKELDDQILIKALTRLKETADGSHKPILEEFLALLQTSPPEFYTYSKLIKNLFGFARSQDNLIALHQALSDNPLAVFHEICEYLAQSKALKLTLKESTLAISINNSPFTISLNDEALAIAHKDSTSPHYLLRALQKEIFGKRDIELTEKIRAEQNFALHFRSLDSINPLEALKDDFVRKYITLLLQQRYSKFDLDPKLAERIISTLASHTDNPKEAQHALYSEVIDFRTDAKFKAAYARYKVGQKFEPTMRLFLPYIDELINKQGEILIIDVGCGNNALGAEIVNRREKVEVTGTDIFDWHIDFSNPKLKFKVQEDPRRLPFKDNEADLIILHAVLHHVASEDMPYLLAEIKRVLKPGGRVLILEDTSSHITWTDMKEDILELKYMFLLFTREQQIKYYRFHDWYANIVVGGLESMFMPYENFGKRTIENWVSFLQMHGFLISNTEFIHSQAEWFHQSPAGFIVAEISLNKNGILSFDRFLEMRREARVGGNERLEMLIEWALWELHEAGDTRVEDISLSSWHLSYLAAKGEHFPSLYPFSSEASYAWRQAYKDAPLGSIIPIAKYSLAEFKEKGMPVGEQVSFINTVLEMIWGKVGGSRKVSPEAIEWVVRELLSLERMPKPAEELILKLLDDWLGLNWQLGLGAAFSYMFSSTYILVDIAKDRDSIVKGNALRVLEKLHRREIASILFCLTPEAEFTKEDVYIVEQLFAEAIARIKTGSMPFERLKEVVQDVEGALFSNMRQRYIMIRNLFAVEAPILIGDPRLPLAGSFSEFSITNQDSRTGNLMGKLFDAAGKMVTEGIVAIEENGYLSFGNAKDQTILYVKDGKKARIKLGKTTAIPKGLFTQVELARLNTEVSGLGDYVKKFISSGRRVQLIEDNENIFGFSDGDTLYITKEMLKHKDRLLHELGEGFFALHPESLPRGINAHTFLRGCGKDIRNLMPQINNIDSITTEELISFIQTKLQEAKLPERQNEAEFALIRHNYGKGLRGRELIYGLQDRMFGEGINVKFSEEIEAKQIKGTGYLLDKIGKRLSKLDPIIVLAVIEEEFRDGKISKDLYDTTRSLVIKRDKEFIKLILENIPPRGHELNLSAAARAPPVIILINSNHGRDTRAIKPVGLARISSSLKIKGFRVEFIDASYENLTPQQVFERVKAISEEMDAKVIAGFSSLPNDSEWLKSTTELFNEGTKGDKILLVAGGYLPTMRYAEFLQDFPNIDFAIRGEGEIAIVELIEAIKDKRSIEDVHNLIYRNADGVVMVNPHLLLTSELLEREPFIDYSLLETSSANVFIKKAMIDTAHGCPGNCKFCGIHAFFEERTAGNLDSKRQLIWRPRSAKRVVDEMEFLHYWYGIEGFDIVDDDFIGLSPERAEEIADEIMRRGLKIKFWFLTRAKAIIGNEKVFRKLKEAGLTQVYLGIESADSEQLRYYAKGITAEENSKAISIIQELGIDLRIGLINFYEFTTFEQLERNTAFIERHNLQTAVPGMMIKLLVYKKTRLYDELLKRHVPLTKITDSIWDYPFRDPDIEKFYNATNGFSKRVHPFASHFRSLVDLGYFEPTALTAKAKEVYSDIRHIEFDFFKKALRIFKNSIGRNTYMASLEILALADEREKETQEKVTDFNNWAATNGYGEYAFSFGSAALPKKPVFQDVELSAQNNTVPMSPKKGWHAIKFDRVSAFSLTKAISEAIEANGPEIEKVIEILGQNASFSWIKNTTTQDFIALRKYLVGRFGVEMYAGANLVITGTQRDYIIAALEEAAFLRQEALTILQKRYPAWNNVRLEDFKGIVNAIATTASFHLRKHVRSLDQRKHYRIWRGSIELNIHRVYALGEAVAAAVNEVGPGAGNIFERLTSENNIRFNWLKGLDKGEFIDLVKYIAKQYGNYYTFPVYFCGPNLIITAAQWQFFYDVLITAKSRRQQALDSIKKEHPGWDNVTIDDFLKMPQLLTSRGYRYEEQKEKLQALDFQNIRDWVRAYILEHYRVPSQEEIRDEFFLPVGYIRSIFPLAQLQKLSPDSAIILIDQFNRGEQPLEISDWIFLQGLKLSKSEVTIRQGVELLERALILYRTESNKPGEEKCLYVLGRVFEDLYTRNITSKDRNKERLTYYRARALQCYLEAARLAVGLIGRGGTYNGKQTEKISSALCRGDRKKSPLRFYYGDYHPDTYADVACGRLEDVFVMLVERRGLPWNEILERIKSMSDEDQHTREMRRLIAESRPDPKELPELARLFIAEAEYLGAGKLSPELIRSTWERIIPRVHYSYEGVSALAGAALDAALAYEDKLALRHLFIEKYQDRTAVLENKASRRIEAEERIEQKIEEIGKATTGAYIDFIRAFLAGAKKSLGENAYAQFIGKDQQDLLKGLEAIKRAFSYLQDGKFEGQAVDMYFICAAAILFHLGSIPGTVGGRGQLAAKILKASTLPGVEEKDKEQFINNVMKGIASMNRINNTTQTTMFSLETRILQDASESIESPSAKRAELLRGIKEMLLKRKSFIFAIDKDGSLVDANSLIDRESALLLLEIFELYFELFKTGFPFIVFTNNTKKSSIENVWNGLMDVFQEQYERLPDEEKQKKKKELFSNFIIDSSGGEIWVCNEEDSFVSMDEIVMDENSVASIKAVLEKVIDEHKSAVEGASVPLTPYGERIDIRKSDKGNVIQVTFYPTGKDIPKGLKDAYDVDHTKRALLKEAIVKLIKERGIKGITVEVSGKSSIDIASGDKRMRMERLVTFLSKRLNLTEEDIREIIIYFGDEFYPGGGDFSLKEIVALLVNLGKARALGSEAASAGSKFINPDTDDLLGPARMRAYLKGIVALLQEFVVQDYTTEWISKLIFASLQKGEWDFGETILLAALIKRYHTLEENLWDLVFASRGNKRFMEALAEFENRNSVLAAILQAFFNAEARQEGECAVLIAFIKSDATTGTIQQKEEKLSWWRNRIYEYKSAAVKLDNAAQFWKTIDEALDPLIDVDVDIGAGLAIESFSSATRRRRLVLKHDEIRLPPAVGQDSGKGNAIGKLFDSSGNMVVTGVQAVQEGDYLVFKKDGNILYVKNGNEAKVKVISLPTVKVDFKDADLTILDESLRNYIIQFISGKEVILIEDNEHIKGFADKEHLYISKSLLNNPIALFHELGEQYFAQHPELLPEGVNSHTFLRGCGKHIRELLKDREFTDPEELITFLETNLPQERHNPAEFALIRHNAKLGLTSRELIYGLQDRVFGEGRNVGFSEELQATIKQPSIAIRLLARLKVAISIALILLLTLVNPVNASDGIGGGDISGIGAMPETLNTALQLSSSSDPIMFLLYGGLVVVVIVLSVLLFYFKKKITGIQEKIKTANRKYRGSPIVQTFGGEGAYGGAYASPQHWYRGQAADEHAEKINNYRNEQEKARKVIKILSIGAGILLLGILGLILLQVAGFESGFTLIPVPTQIPTLTPTFTPTLLPTQTLLPTAMPTIIPIPMGSDTILGIEKEGIPAFIFLFVIIAGFLWVLFRPRKDGDSSHFPLNVNYQAVAAKLLQSGKKIDELIPPKSYFYEIKEDGKDDQTVFNELKDKVVHKIIDTFQQNGVALNRDRLIALINTVAKKKGPEALSNLMANLRNRGKGLTFEFFAYDEARGYTHLFEDCQSNSVIGANLAALLAINHPAQIELLIAIGLFGHELFDEEALTEQPQDKEDWENRKAQENAKLTKTLIQSQTELNLTTAQLIETLNPITKMESYYIQGLRQHAPDTKIRLALIALLIAALACNREQAEALEAPVGPLIQCMLVGVSIIAGIAYYWARTTYDPDYNRVHIWRRVYGAYVMSWLAYGIFDILFFNSFVGIIIGILFWWVGKSSLLREPEDSKDDDGFEFTVPNVSISSSI
ncbi:MAG TPA: hypothetical protein DCY56_06400 [Candidatus Omnitrophica bacterium]|nr:hypothetical protein [Candidatus Omnitrophota bacterium]